MAHSRGRRFNGVADHGSAKVKVALTAMLLAAGGLLLLAEARAQSNASNDATTEKNDQPQGKTKRVWDNDEIQKLKGGISVVGNPSSSRTGNPKPATTRPAAVLQTPIRRFKATTLDGEEITSESLQGKTVLVQFWATWCPHCRRDQAPVDSITRDFEDKGLAVLAVDVDEPKNTVIKYLKQYPRSCQIILAKDTDLTALYPQSGFPTYVLIDRNGHTVGTKKGELGEQGLRNFLGRAGIAE